MTEKITQATNLEPTMHDGIEVGDTVYTSFGGYWRLSGTPQLCEYVVDKKSPSGRLAVKSQSRGNYTNTLYFKTREEAFAYWRGLAEKEIETHKEVIQRLLSFAGQCHD